jgi:hypothetical protein
MGIQHLHVEETVEEQDAVGEFVGELHLFDGFLAPDFGHLQQAPIVQEPVVQPVLVDGGKLAAQALVQVIDDFGVALHDALPSSSCDARRWSAWNDSETDFSPMQPFQLQPEKAGNSSDRRDIRTRRMRSVCSRNIRRGPAMPTAVTACLRARTER